MMPLWIVAGLGLYGLNWSILFSPLSGQTVAFLSIAAACFLLLAITVGAAREPEAVAKVRRLPVAVVTAYFMLAYAVNGGIPLLQISQTQSYDIYSFGIDGVHIFMLCFTGYLGVRLFRAAIELRSWRSWLGFGWIVALLASIGNRSAVSFLMFACLFIFVRRTAFRVRTVLILGAVLAAFGWVFGQFGNARLSFQIGQATQQVGDLDAIARISGASDAFIGTGLEPAWLWVYMYFVSPIANLNQAFLFAGPQLCGRTCDLPSFAAFEVAPDVLGVRFAELFHADEFAKSAFLIAPDLTASTAFGSAVGYAGWVGALTVLILYCIVSVLVVRIVRHTEVAEEGYGLLGTLIFFAFFENMVAYSALSLQLVFVLIRARARWSIL